MSDLSAKQVLSNLYGLMMEMNYHRLEEEVVVELHQNHNPLLEKHLVKIRQITAKLKSQHNKSRFQQAVDYIQKLKEKGIDEFRQLLEPQEQAQLVPLFRKFEELTENDEAAILEDQELLHFIEMLKSKLDESQEQ